MAKFLFFLESQTIIQSRRDRAFRASLSHDDHLIQIAGAALSGGHEVYVASIDEYDPGVKVARLLETHPFFCIEKTTAAASDFAFDIVLVAYPDVPQRKFFPGAKTVGYFPALYFVEMPEHFMTGRMYYLLRSVQHQLDFFVFQNERQAEFLNIMSRALCGVDIGSLTYIMPYGISDTLAAPDFDRREQLRRELGIAEDDLVLIHGGGAWRWTDFHAFLRQYLDFVQENPDAKIKLVIPGLTQSHNKDHDDYITGIEKLLAANHSLVQDLQNNHNWKILYIQEWDRASKSMDNLYLISDLGISISPPTLEYFLSHRVRVVSYVANGLGLLLADGDSYSAMKELAPICHTVDTSAPDCYYKALQNLTTGPFRGRYSYMENGASARARFRNQETKLQILNNMLRTTNHKTYVDCPINYVFHMGKVDAVKKAIISVFEQVLSE